MIHEIYRLFIREKSSAWQIARKLTARKISRRGEPWNSQSVLTILKHLKYTGSLVWGRSAGKLHTRIVPVSRPQWRIRPGALCPIVDEKTFQAAQKILRDRPQSMTNDVVLNKVRSLLAKEGRLNARLLNGSYVTPSAGCCKQRFGSLRNVYELLGYTPADSSKVHKETFQLTTRLHRLVVRDIKKYFGKSGVLHG